MRSWKPLETVVCLVLAVIASGAFAKLRSDSAAEAPTGFKTHTLSEEAAERHSVGNGMMSDEEFTSAQITFEEEDGEDNGLGPVYNSRGCVDCHQNPVTGGASQVSVLRAGHRGRNGFQNPTVQLANGASIPNRSLINDRAICPEAQERVPRDADVRTFRMSLNLLGDGFVEAIDDNTLLNLARQQRQLTGGRVAGQAIPVPLLEAPGQTRIGRFGWKTQQASLLSFAADAYLNEQGITNRLIPHNVTTACMADPSKDNEIEDEENDIDIFAAFMRGSLAPPVDATLAATAQAKTGRQVFSDIGCAICHVSSITTAPAGTVINGGTFTIPAALGSKIIHPYSDFLLHDVGTGDGIVQNGPPETANKLRTPPLWGLRARNRYMHDGLSTSVANAVQRHGGEATWAARRYSSLGDRQRWALHAFLNSL